MTVLLRVLWVLSGIIVGQVLFMWLFALLDVNILNPGNADAGQLGVLGFPIGGPIGALAGFWLGGRKERWLWAIGGAPVGAFLGCGLAESACTILGIWKVIPFDIAGLLIGMVLGSAGGWFLSGRDWAS